MKLSNQWLDRLERPLWDGCFGVCLLYDFTVKDYLEQKNHNKPDAIVNKINEKIELLLADTIYLKEHFPHEINNGTYFYPPIVFVEWAIIRGLPVPNELREFIKSHYENKEIVRLALNELELQPEPLSEQQLIEYIKHRKWTALQAIFILHGKKPQGTDDNTRYELQRHFIQAYSYLAQDAMTADDGEPLKPKTIGGGITTCCETPDFWFSWAQTKGLPIDTRLIQHFNSNPVTKLQLDVIEDGVEQKTESGNQPNGRELKQGLKDIWIKEGRPEMKFFFPDKLKKYKNKPGSPILEVYSAGKNAGIDYETSYGTKGTLKKKTISNYVSEFKKTP